MKFLYIISFFFFLNFLLFLMPRLMPNVITKGQTIFWIIWVNSMFLFTLILPHQASFIFPAKSALNIMGAFKKATGMGKSSNKPDKNKDSASNTDTKVVASESSKQSTKENSTSSSSDGLSDRIRERKEKSQ